MTSDLQAGFPKPKFITGGCLCGALRYRVDFPPSHDFIKASGTCQCTQCRRQTGALFFMTQSFSPASCFQFTSNTSTLKNYRATPQADRGFCSDCGTLLYWKPVDRDASSITLGTVDPLYLFGEGANEENGVPEKGGYGFALANGGGTHSWCTNEIPGVTDNIPILGATGRGTRVDGD
ncbi:Mss4-like protein [Apodospora peruviana]|uniref:Mss4-like protein n=1 Tax=Apodospora peruviana TaxID=516989 RepID=A0AAE0I5V8_9PEZI|nr:Mss4-like protein [Apodospora peruviana]